MDDLLTTPPQRHGIEGRKIVERQRALVRRLREDGHNANEAERTLDPFEQSLAIFEDHLEVLESERAPQLVASSWSR
jgi:hypothetical protein